MRPEADTRKQWSLSGDSSCGQGQGGGSLGTGVAVGLEGGGGLEVTPGGSGRQEWRDQSPGPAGAARG